MKPLSCVPALGETLHVSIGQNVTFLARFDQDGGATPELYHSLEGDWQVTPFGRAEEMDVLAIGSSAKLWAASVRCDKAGEFTFRVRRDEGHIEWLGTPGSNGKVLIAPEPAHSSSAMDTSIVRHDLGEDDKVAFLELESGDRDMSTALVLERDQDSWLMPRLVSSLRDVRDNIDTQLVLVLSSDKQRVTGYLPLSTVNCGTALRRRDDKLCLRCQRDLGVGSVQGLVVQGEASAARVHEMIAEMVRLGREEVSRINEMPVKATQTRPTRKGIRYCTYNALGTWFSGEQAADILRQLVKADFVTGEAIDSFLLDDGWQDIVSSDEGQMRRLSSFGAHKGFMPVKGAERAKQPEDSGFSSPSHDMHTLDDEAQALEQLADAVKLIRQQLPKRDARVGVWLALEGYWDGCSADGPIAARFGPLVEYQHGDHGKEGVSGSTWFLPKAADFDRFWRSYFSDLKEAGIDFVKVDNQAWIDYALDAELRVRMSHSMTAAAKAIWGSDEALSHCMAMTARTMTGALGMGLLTETEPVFRNSNDYYPAEPASHRSHIATNAANATLTRHLSLTPDFDMFQTKHEYARFHAVLRTFSPAPLLITDTPKSHDVYLLQDLTAPRKNGHLAVVQSMEDKPFQLHPFEDVLRGPRALKLGLTTAVGAVIGIFNCIESGDEAIDSLEMRDFRALFGSHGPRGSYGVYHQAAQVSKVVDDLSEAVEPIAVLSLPSKAAEVVAIVPMHKLSKKVAVGCVGLVDKLNPLVAVREVELMAPTSKVVSRASSPLSMQEIEAPSAMELLYTLRDRLLDSSLPGRLRSSPVRTVVDEANFFIRALFTFATLVAVHLLSVALSRSPMAIAPVYMPLLSEKLAYEDDEKAGTPCALRVEIDLAGRLGFMCSDRTMRERLDFSIDGVKVPSHAIKLAGVQMVELEMNDALSAPFGGSSGDCWIVDVSLRQ